MAKAAGITKGGVQYCFGNKDGLVDAMHDRWLRIFEDRLAAEIGDGADPGAMLRAYLRVGLHGDTATDWARSAVMMTVMVHFPEQVERYRQSGRSYFERFDLATPEGRRQALALVAADGMFLLRGFGFMQFSEDEWRLLAQEVEALVPPSDIEER